ncbi:uncharacterized protein Z518_06425 [Rhinocladiella mackenziei CBS 650.93]|uniref:Rhinocladiella mackenziei CBS 650.93 unplaced genomic scaffold supercont1.4, whole genome shotgun sequence n=1 Tax=Rhinocladiella mackenziei CBS 650.93 TaxID=1442369 RepID=A0A0D2H577_9EURO|nr:uncharacterized protein Z518_06425 [Rhinocladiella mackenziei CBS 650.93]KIX05553.1 hypothetical protein Z518_06425 [Rhinocladiella mackenziei CBS 650.93]
MPSLKAYTPYETLAFCQSVARHGSDTAAFEDIATSLNANGLIRQSQTYDQTRLTANALRALYQDLLAEEKDEDIPKVNGDNVNPRKRKLSTSPAPSESDETDQKLLRSLIDKLYARFREQTIKEIREEEEAYRVLQAEISNLEKRDEDEQNQQDIAEKIKAPSQAGGEPQKTTDDGALNAPEPQTRPDAAAAQLHASLDASRTDTVAPGATVPTSADASASPSSVRSGQHQPVAASNSPAPSTPNIPSARPSAEPGQVRPSQPPSAPPQHQSPGAFHRTLPVPSPGRPNYGPINQQHFQPGPQGQPVPILPPISGMPHMPPPTEFPPQKRSSPASGQGRGSPIHMPPQQAYPGYPPYPQPPWSHQFPQQYPQPPPYPSPQFYMQSPPGPPGIPYQTSHHPSYSPYPQSAPIPYQSQPPPPHSWHPQPGQPYYGYHGSGTMTPVARSDSKQPPLRGRSSTPWKRRSELPNGARQPSPVRPERDVSPLTDTESTSRSSKPRKSPKSPSKKNQRADENVLSTRETPLVRGRQATSATPSAFAGSRSQSITSFNSDTPTEKRRKGRRSEKIKAEPPSTPAPLPSDTEQTQRSSGGRGRPRNSTVSSRNDLNRITITAKRKRSPGGDSATPLASPARVPIPHQTLHNPSLVVVSKNFTKTSHLLLNDIVSHKLAGIFARPLSERDAPGYKDLVFRPQDLKSIKVAISRGGKAAFAAIESLEGEDRSGEETPTGNALTLGSDARERSMGNGVYLVKTSEDLVPPRGIVNSSQLEMELARMFANAVMFNPLPTSERGFGRSFRLRKQGGHIEPDRDPNDLSSSEEGTPVDEGGIISDTREMFEDILAQVRKWREVELERLGGEDVTGTGSKGAQSSASLAAHGSASASVRHSSVSSAMNDDDAGGDSGAVSTTVPVTGTVRKRRRIAEN